MVSTIDQQTLTALTEGCYVHKRVDTSTLQSCHLKVDDDFMFLVIQFRSYPIKKEIESIELTYIKEVRVGHCTKENKTSQHSDLEIYSDKLLSISYGNDITNLSLVQFVTPSSSVATLWTKGLNKILYSTSSRHLSFQGVLRKQWKRLRYSTNSKGLIPVRRILKLFGHDKNEKIFFQKVKKVGINLQKNDELKPSELTFESFKNMYESCCIRDDIAAVFDQICKPNTGLVELPDLVCWLNENQRDPRSNEILIPFFDIKRASAIINQHEPDVSIRKRDCLSLKGFENFLASDDNPLIYLNHIKLNMDMTKPLSHYFINSSHNTYLTGSQFGGKSSVEIYRSVLLSGCRCIELDCWDGKGDMSGEPIITHGKAMCTDVMFRDVLVAIKETAFIASQYPVILSFETHCTKPMQLKMANYCIEIFGNFLLSKNLDDFPLEPGVALPSPASLLRKILIKNKKLPQELSKNLPEVLENLEDSIPGELDEALTTEAHPELNDEIKPDEMENLEVKEKRSMRVVSTKSSESDSKKNRAQSATSDDIDQQEIMRNYVYVKTSYTNIHSKLSELVNYCQSVKFLGFKKLKEEKIETKCSFHMSSFNETVGLHHLKNNSIEFVDYNKVQMSRIYPRGSRVDSSNYIPQPFWDAGCQMASLNFQTTDLGMQVNAGKFEYNDNCGYLLKPGIMTADNRVFDPFAESTVDGVIAASCRVKVISALFLAEKPVNSFVEVDMFGLPNDTIRKEFRTQLVVNNSLNPTYPSNEFRFRKVICPDLALLRFAVLDDSRQVIGQRIIPFNSLQSGYHYVGLRSTSGVPLDNATIFVKITLGSYVPEIFQDVVSALENPCAHQISLRKQHEQQLKNLVDDLDEDLEEEIEENSEISEKGNSSNTAYEITAKTSSHSSKKSTQKSSSASIKINNRRSNTSGSRDVSCKDTQQNYSMTLPDSVSLLHNKEFTEDFLNRFVSRHISLEDIRTHHSYLSSMNPGKNKKSSKKSSKKIEVITADTQTNSCCWPGSLIFCKKRNNSTLKVDGTNIVVKNEKSDEETNFVKDKEETEKKERKAVFTALEVINQEFRKKLHKAQEKEMNELKTNQTKAWMERTKEVGRDPRVPAAERERRIRELQGQEVRKFTEERQLLTTRQAKQLSRFDCHCEKRRAELVEKLKC